MPGIHDLYGNSDSEGKGTGTLKEGNGRMVGYLGRNSVSKGIQRDSSWYSILGVKPVTFRMNITNSHGTSFEN